jgi:transposase-like protein
MSKTSKVCQLRCPRCKATELWKFGRDPKTAEQRHRCKKCLHQFVPGRPKRPTPEILLACPKCAAPMHAFKHLEDATRFRCSKHNAKGSEKCAHKINLPLGRRKMFQNVVAPERVRLVAGKISPVFHWNKMKFSSATVALAMYLTICEGNPATQVAKIMHNLYGLPVSHDTITRWHHKTAFLLSEKTRDLIEIPRKPGRKPRVYADETELNGGKNKRWFWMIYCRKYDLMLGRNLTARRDTRAARDLLAMTQKLAPQLQNAELLTDGLWSYPSAMGDLGIPPQKHLRYISFFERPNNNALERKWSNFKNRARVFRGIRSDLGKMAYIEGQIFYHNCLKPSKLLAGATPYQHLGIQLPQHQTELELIHKLLTT